MDHGKSRNERETPRQLQVEQTDLAFLYQQYWEHARHAENQLWNYTRIWALVLTAIATILGSPLPRNAKIAATCFGILLSVLGLLLVYALRVSYVAFTYKSEVVAINEMGVHPEYTRYIRDWTTDGKGELPETSVWKLIRLPLVKTTFEAVGRLLPGKDEPDQRERLKKDKLLDMPDILKLSYTIVIIAGIVILGVLLEYPLTSVLVATVVLYLIVVYNRIAYRSKERSRRNVTKPLDRSKLARPLDDD